jgi:hypothetical protein
MTAVDDTPYNKNFMNPLNFVFQIKRAPYLNFFVQQVNLPGISIDYSQQPNPFVHIPVSGEHIQFSDLKVTFKVDEELQNWFEIHNWLRELGFPNDFQEYASIANTAPTSGNGVTSDISLVILDAVKLPAWEVTFRNAFPTSLSDITFQTTDSTVNYITATATFRYILYDVVQVK